MTVLSELQQQRVLIPNGEVPQLHNLSARLDERQLQDMHLAAADILLRRQLAAGQPPQLPMQPSSIDTVMGLLTSDCGVRCLAGRPAVEQLDVRLDVFLFTGDLIKAESEIPRAPEEFLQYLEDQADQTSRGLEVLGVADQDRSAYRALQPLIWASKAVLYFGPGAVGRITVEDAVAQLVERYLIGATGLAE